MFFERHENGGETAVLVHIDFPEGANREDVNEFRELVVSAGADPVELVTTRRDVPDAKTFIGKGKVEEIAGVLRMYGAELVIFNHSLSPSQERNLERALQCRVLDRTGLILDIFAHNDDFTNTTFHFSILNRSINFSDNSRIRRIPSFK